MLDDVRKGQEPVSAETSVLHNDLKTKNSNNRNITSMVRTFQKKAFWPNHLEIGGGDDDDSEVSTVLCTVHMTWIIQKAYK
jgi:hypothetical protein